MTDDSNSPGSAFFGLIYLPFHVIQDSSFPIHTLFIHTPVHPQIFLVSVQLFAMEVCQRQAAEPSFAQFKSNAFSGTEGVYMLPHHVLEIDRLRRQHLFMKSTTNGALLVMPLSSEKKALRVLDSGCADGL